MSEELAAKPYCSVKRLSAYDIWMRDFCPIRDDKGDFVCFKYKPDYLKQKDNPTAIQSSIKKHYSNIKEINLIMDGGHFVFNGNGVFLVSEKVLTMNTQSQEEITQTIQSLGFDKVVWLPYDKDEKTGHLDGTMQFLDDETLVMNDDSGKEETIRCLFEETQAIIRKHCPNIKIIAIPAVYFDELDEDGFLSAKGLYTNFVQTQNALFVPQYGLETDAQAIAFLKQHTAKPIIPIEMGNIPARGGSLHCMTAST